MAINNEKPELKPEDLLDLFVVSCITRLLNEAIAIRRKYVFGACLLGLLQELVSIIPFFALWKKGIFLESIKSVDHRTIWGAKVMADFVNRKLGIDHCDHVADLLRNNFLKATGGNRGRDGNAHSKGCMLCMIIGLLASDMGRFPGFAAGITEEIRRRKWIGALRRPVGIAFYGEGAAQQGGIHEAYNAVAASNYRLTDEELKKYDEKFLDEITKTLKVLRGGPMIFCINRNQYALFTNAAEEYGRSDLVKRALGYANMVGVKVSDRDPIHFYQESVLAIERAQNLVSTLMVIDSYRGTSHNEDQKVYAPGALEARDFGRVDKVFGVEDINEFRNAWENDPIKKLKEYIIDVKAASAETLDNIFLAERKKMDELAERILQEPDITVEEDQKDRSIFCPIDWKIYPVEKPKNPNFQTKMMGHNNAFNWELEQLMSEDDRVIYFGEDDAQGGVLGLTKGLLKKFGPSRIWNMPLSEEWGAAAAAGKGIFGSKPWLEFQFGHFSRDADAVFACVAPQWYQKKLRVDFVSIFPCGVLRRGGSGEYHESWLEKNLYEKKGIVIVCPADAYELVGLMRAAYEFEGPVAFLLQMSAANYREFSTEVPLEPYLIPFGKARFVRQGNDCTVVVYGAACVSAAKNEADYLKEENDISVEVIDLRTVDRHHLDLETIKKSVEKTGRLVLMHEARIEQGVGTDILALLMQKGGVQDCLRTRYTPIIYGGMDGQVFIPTAETLVWARLPYYRTEIDSYDEKRRPIKLEIHRSKVLADTIKDLVGVRK